MRLQVPTLVQAIVDRFYPERLGALSAGDSSTAYAILDGTEDAPATIAAAYTNRTDGVARVLARDTTGNWEPVAETPDFLALPGGRCGVRLTDLDFDGRPEIFVNFAGARAVTTWAFGWDGMRLANLTPTERTNRGDTSLLLSALSWDLDHMGPLRIIAERAVERPAPRVRPRNPAFVYRPGQNGLEVEKTIVAVMGFRADANPESNLRPFRLIEDSQPPYTMRIINGERGGRNRVSATIFVNNRAVAVPREINTSVEFATVPLSELFTENHLTATLTGPPDGRLIVLIEDSTPREPAV
jgi:hypothetical protein